MSVQLTSALCGITGWGDDQKTMIEKSYTIDQIKELVKVGLIKIPTNNDLASKNEMPYPSQNNNNFEGGLCMDGRVVLHNGKWKIDFRRRQVGGYIARDRSGTLFWSKEHAQRTLEHIRCDIDNKRFNIEIYQKQSTFQKKFKEYIERACSRKGTPWSPAYKSKANEYYENYFKDFFDSKIMSDIEDEDIEEFYYSLPKTISTKTKLNIINALKAFFNSYRITRKKNLEFPSPIPNDPAWQWIEEDRQDLIISKIPEQNKPAFLFMKYHLTRQGETRALMKDCVDLKKGIVTIKRNFSNEVLTKITKGRKDCSMPIDPDFMPIMERLCKEIPAFKNDFIFRVQRGKRKGEYYARNTLRKIWNKAEKDAEVPHIQLHWGTRNSGASQLLEDGASLKDIQELLRHADLKTTDKAYAHYQRKKLIKIMQLRKKKNHLRVVK